MEKSSRIPEKDVDVSDVAFSASEPIERRLLREMKEKVKLLAGPWVDSDTKEARIARAARAAGISFRQAKSLYYGETQDPRSSVVERVREAAAAVEHRQEAKAREAAHSILDTVTSALLEAQPHLDREGVALALRRLGFGRLVDRSVGS